MNETTTAAASTETITRAFAVILGRRLDVEGLLVSLQKRAERRGLVGGFTWTWGQASTRREHHADFPCAESVGCTGCSSVTRVSLTVTGTTPKYEGWSFAAALTHLEGENLVRSFGEVALSPTYRTRGPVCDHCKASRRRSETFVLVHEDGRTVQVGSTCIADFLGSDDALRAMYRATLLAAMFAAGENGESEGFGSRSSEFPLFQILPFVAFAVRVNGWMSRGAAREKGGTATADHAMRLLTDKVYARNCNCAVSDEDVALATAAAGWAETLTDAEVDAAEGDYLHNVRAVARSGYVSPKSIGIGASIVVAYQRHVARERARAERAARPTLNAHLGTVGDKVTFGLPLQVGKRGKPLKNAPVVLSAEPVTLDFVTGYETAFGYITVCKFKTAEGATIVWKASDGAAGIPDRSCVGKRYTLGGTIKKHDEYKGEKQTALTRCSITEVTVS